MTKVLVVFNFDSISSSPRFFVFFFVFVSVTIVRHPVLVSIVFFLVISRSLGASSITIL